MRIRFVLATPLVLGALALQAQTPAPPKRPMTFLDVQRMRQIGSPTPSPDGKWLLYTLSMPDWKEGKRQTDIHLVSLEDEAEKQRKEEEAKKLAEGGSETKP